MPVVPVGAVIATRLVSKVAGSSRELVTFPGYQRSYDHSLGRYCSVESPRADDGTRFFKPFVTKCNINLALKHV